VPYCSLRCCLFEEAWSRARACLGRVELDDCHECGRSKAGEQKSNRKGPPLCARVLPITPSRHAHPCACVLHLVGVPIHGIARRNKQYARVGPGGLVRPHACMLPLASMRTHVLMIIPGGLVRPHAPGKHAHSLADDYPRWTSAPACPWQACALTC